MSLNSNLLLTPEILFRTYKVLDIRSYLQQFFLLYNIIELNNQDSESCFSLIANRFYFAISVQLYFSRYCITVNRITLKVIIVNAKSNKCPCCKFNKP